MKKFLLILTLFGFVFGPMMPQTQAAGAKTTEQSNGHKKGHKKHKKHRKHHKKHGKKGKKHQSRKHGKHHKKHRKHRKHAA